MIIEIESAYGDKLIYGKHLDKCELQKAVKDILQGVNEEGFELIFCGRYGYEVIPYSDDIVVDYIIDLDTHRVL